jgi:hypothetical protein
VPALPDSTIVNRGTRSPSQRCTGCCGTQSTWESSTRTPSDMPASTNRWFHERFGTEPGSVRRRQSTSVRQARVCLYWHADLRPLRLRYHGGAEEGRYVYYHLLSLHGVQRSMWRRVCPRRAPERAAGPRWSGVFK